MSNEINSDNLNDILKDLGKTYRKLGGKAFPAEITIVGGAAVLAMYDSPEIKQKETMVLDNKNDSHGMRRGSFCML